ncbi:HK97 family phage prohead protease [uncultured Clostridium sp.]|uniref:HK97 family phage prohead protease n=1 Tax=uncultured Clostridium sp. TaxID=59620 RepID=UPI00261AB565|nr:HK97 family phage prohead protease [uncultured Clostridium sp.]
MEKEFETRILEIENRSVQTNVQIRTNGDLIYIIGCLPILSLSEVLRDRKTNKRFREYIAPGAFKDALTKNKAKGYKTKLLLNHQYTRELFYSSFDFKEGDEGLNFEFVLPKLDRNLEILKGVDEKNCSFSFGFILGKCREYPSEEEGTDYIRCVEAFAEFREISILDKYTAPAYSKANGFKANNKEDAKNKVEKVATSKRREQLTKLQEEQLEDMRKKVEALKGNKKLLHMAGYRTPAEFKREVQKLKYKY